MQTPLGAAQQLQPQQTLRSEGSLAFVRQRSAFVRQRPAHHHPLKEPRFLFLEGVLLSAFVGVKHFITEGKLK